MAEGKTGVTFDEDYKIRVLDSEQYDQSKELLADCESFSEQLGRLGETVGAYVKHLDEQRAKIDREKLQAVGLRNRVAAREEDVRKKEEDLQTAISERRVELERVAAEVDALARLQQEQELLIAQLSSAQE
ncbi:unnamed protein product [Pedinophyceae sp. YPF-701]|nr:unnamed protein product [Pedinophyceae sp. YPF-701]